MNVMTALARRLRQSSFRLRLCIASLGLFVGLSAFAASQPTTPEVCRTCAPFSTVSLRLVSRYALGNGEAINGIAGSSDGTVYATSYHAIGILRNGIWQTVVVPDVGVAAAGRNRLWFRISDKSGPLVSITGKGIIDRKKLWTPPIKSCDAEQVAIDARDDPWAIENCFVNNDPIKEVRYVVVYDHRDGSLISSKLVPGIAHVGLVTNGFVYGANGIFAASIPIGLQPLVAGGNGDIWSAGSNAISRSGRGTRDFVFHGPQTNFYSMSLPIPMWSDGTGGIFVLAHGLCRINVRNIVYCDPNVSVGDIIPARDGSFVGLDYHGRSLIRFRFDGSKCLRRSDARPHSLPCFS